MNRTRGCRSEKLSLPAIQERVAAGSVVYADEGSCWGYLTKRINHSEAYSMKGACTNQAESFF
jgi:ISXO2-like transposase domain